MPTEPSYDDLIRRYDDVAMRCNCLRNTTTQHRHEICNIDDVCRADTGRNRYVSSVVVWEQRWKVVTLFMRPTVASSSLSNTPFLERCSSNMPSRKKSTPRTLERRWGIVALYKKNKHTSIRSIAKAAGTSWRMARKWVSVYQKTGRGPMRRRRIRHIRRKCTSMVASAATGSHDWCL